MMEFKTPKRIATPIPLFGCCGPLPLLPPLIGDADAADAPRPVSITSSSNSMWLLMREGSILLPLLPLSKDRTARCCGCVGVPPVPPRSRSDALSSAEPDFTIADNSSPSESSADAVLFHVDLFKENQKSEDKGKGRSVTVRGGGAAVCV